MGTKLSKVKPYTCCKPTTEFGHRERSATLSCWREDARDLITTFLRSNDTSLGVVDLFVDQAFLECLVTETKKARLVDENDTRRRNLSLVLFNCCLNLQSGDAVSAFAEFVSLYNLKALEFWDGELPVHSQTLQSLFRVLAQEAPASLERLRLDNISLSSSSTTFRVGDSLSGLLRSCTNLSHVELHGCMLDLATAEQLAEGLRHHANLTQMVLNACPMDNLTMALVLRGLATCPRLQHLHLIANPLLTTSSLLALTLFVKDCANRKSRDGLQELYLPHNPNLLAGGEDNEGALQTFFDALIQHGCRLGELHLCDTGLDVTAAVCLFRALARHDHLGAVERLDLRENPNLELSPRWLQYLERLSSLRALYLPGHLFELDDEWSPSNNSALLARSLQRNTSLLTCPLPQQQQPVHPGGHQPLGGSASCRRIAKILNRNKLFYFVDQTLLSPSSSDEDADIVVLPDALLPWAVERVASPKHDPSGSALFSMVRAKSAELAVRRRFGRAPSPTKDFM